MKISQVFKDFKGRKGSQVERRRGRRQGRGAKRVALQTSPATCRHLGITGLYPGPSEKGGLELDLKQRFPSLQVKCHCNMPQTFPSFPTLWRHGTYYFEELTEETSIPMEVTHCQTGSGQAGAQPWTDTYWSCLVSGTALSIRSLSLSTWLNLLRA